MPTFTYTVTNGASEKQKGTLTAESREAAVTKLQSQGHLILELNSEEGSKTGKKKNYRLTRSEKLMFVKHLSAMIGAGLTITESLGILKQQKPRKTMQLFLNELVQLIRGGVSLGKSLEYFGTTFSPIFVNMVKVGESGGNLDTALSYLELQMEKDEEIVKKVKGAMIYPIIIFSLTIILALFLIAFIIPKISGIFTAFKVDLPAPTRLLIQIDATLKEHWGKLLIATFLLIFFLRWLKNRECIKRYTHAFLLKLPIFGKLSRFSNTARFARILSSLLKSGVPMVEGLNIVSKTLVNVRYKKVLEEAKLRVEKGESLGQSILLTSDLFPPMVGHVIQVGEKTGTLEHTMEHLAVMYEKEVDSITKNLSTLMEPLLLVFMGLVVGGIALAIITPIYKLPQLLQR